MQGGSRETVAADLGDEYVSRFGLRDLVEAWIDRVMHELPSDPYQLLIDEADSQRDISGGVKTCPNPWCGMSMPGYVYEVHRSLCNAQEHWTRCVRCNSRVEAARLSSHLTTCRAEPCRFCGGLSLPRMMHLCPIQQLFEADRATNALRYRRNQNEARQLTDAAATMTASTEATETSSDARQATALSAFTFGRAINSDESHGDGTGTTDTATTTKSPSPPFRSPGTPGLGTTPNTEAISGLKPDFVNTDSRANMPSLSPTERSRLSCIQRLWRRHMVGERYRVSVLSKVWESLDMFEERMGVSQSLDGGGFLEGIVESLNASGEDDDQDELDDIMAQSYNHPISSNASSYGDEDDDIPKGGGLRSSSIQALDAANGEDGDEDGAGRLLRQHDSPPGSLASSGTGISGATHGGDTESIVCSFHGVVRGEGDAVALESPKERGLHFGDDDEDDDDDDVGTDTDDRQSEGNPLSSQRGSAVATRRRSRMRRKRQQLWLRVAATPDINGAYMSEESMWALTRLSAHREVFRASLVVAIVRAATRILNERPVVQRVTTPPRGMLVVVGDLHGQMKDLLHLLRVTGGPSPTRYFVFNGDLVDRGPYGCEVLVHVFALLCTYPRYVYINRGNHEDSRTNKEYGFLAELFGKYGVKSSRIHRILSESYTAMPLMTIVDQRYCIVHGGVPRDDCTLQEIEDIGRVKRIPVIEQKTRQERLLVDLLWNDPVEKYQSRQIGDRHQGNGWRSSKRGCGAEYLLNITSRFLKRNGLSMIIRSHDVKPGGFEMIHNNQCVTVFSASNYAGVSGNRGAVAILQTESKYPTYQTWLLQKDTVVRRRASSTGITDDGAGGQGVLTRGSVDLFEDDMADTEDIIEEDPRVVHDEFIRSFYGEHAMLELVKAYVDFSTHRSSTQPSITVTPAAPELSDHDATTTTTTSTATPAATLVTGTTANPAFRLAPFTSEPTILQQLKTIRMLRELIYLHRYSLLVAFNGVDEMRTGVVYKIEWCVVMREVTDLDVPWYYLCQFLAPRLVLDGIPAVEYVRFLRHYDAPFAQHYRPEWQRSMVRRAFSDLDLPDDILRTFREYGDTASTTGSLGRPTSQQNLNGTQPSHSSVVTTQSDERAGSELTTPRGSSQTPSSVPADRGGRDGAGGQRQQSSCSTLGNSPQLEPKPFPRHTSVDAPGELRLPGTPTDSVFGANVDISSIVIDFVTFASRMRSLSPVTATFEDSELYCLFRFFDEEMRGHVYLDTFINQVNEVLNEHGSSLEDSPAELLLSGQDLDFGCVSVTDGSKRPRSASSSSSDDSSASPQKTQTLQKAGGLLARTASSVAAMRRTGGPLAPANGTSSSPLVTNKPGQNASSSSSDNDNDDDKDHDDSDGSSRESSVVNEKDDAEESGKAESTHSTHTRPPGSASASRDTPLLETPAASTATVPPTAQQSQQQRQPHLEPRACSGSVSSRLLTLSPTSTDTDSDEDERAARSIPAPPPRLPLGADSRRASKSVTVAPQPDMPDNHDDAPPGVSKNPSCANRIGEAAVMTLVEVHADASEGPTTDSGMHRGPLAAPSEDSASDSATTNGSSCLPTWNASGHDTTCVAEKVNLSTLTTEAALSRLRATQRERAVKMPWLYPTLIHVQEQLLHRGSDERTYRVFRALNRRRDGKLTQKEFWGLIRFSNTRVDKPVTEEQSNIIFQCIHDDSLVLVQSFCSHVLKQIDENMNELDITQGSSVKAYNVLDVPDSGSNGSREPGTATYRTGHRTSQTAPADEKNSILLSRLRDEEHLGMVYVTALEFVSYFSVVVAEETAIASSACNTNTTTMLTEELGEQLRVLRLEHSNSAFFTDPLVPVNPIFGRLDSRTGTGVAATSTGTGGVILLRGSDMDARHRLSHSSTADISSGSLSRINNNSSNNAYSHNNNNNNSNFLSASGYVGSKSVSSHSLPVLAAQYLPRMSLVGTNANTFATHVAAPPSGYSGSATRQSLGDGAVSTCLEHLRTLFHPNTTLAEISEAFQPSGSTPPALTPQQSQSQMQHTPNQHPRRSVWPAAGLPQTHVPLMGLNSGCSCISADPLGESTQTISVRTTGAGTVLGTPMMLQRAEHRVTTHALFGMGGFGQSSVAPMRRGSYALAGAGSGPSSAHGSTTGASLFAIPRVSVVSVSPMSGTVLSGRSSSSPTQNISNGTSGGGGGAGSGSFAKSQRVNVMVPGPPGQRRARRGLAPASSSSGGTSVPTTGSQSPASPNHNTTHRDGRDSGGNVSSHKPSSGRARRHVGQSPSVDVAVRAAADDGEPHSAMPARAAAASALAKNRATAVANATTGEQESANPPSAVRLEPQSAAADVNSGAEERAKGDARRAETRPRRDRRTSSMVAAASPYATSTVPVASQAGLAAVPSSPKTYVKRADRRRSSSVTAKPVTSASSSPPSPQPPARDGSCDSCASAPARSAGGAPAEASPPPPRPVPTPPVKSNNGTTRRPSPKASSRASPVPKPPSIAARSGVSPRTRAATEPPKTLRAVVEDPVVSPSSVEPPMNGTAPPNTWHDAVRTPSDASSRSAPFQTPRSESLPGNAPARGSVGPVGPNSTAAHNGNDSSSPAVSTTRAAPVPVQVPTARTHHHSRGIVKARRAGGGGGGTARKGSEVTAQRLPSLTGAPTKAPRGSTTGHSHRASNSTNGSGGKEHRSSNSTNGSGGKERRPSTHTQESDTATPNKARRRQHHAK